MNAPAKPKRHLKNYLLDKEFQLTYALIMAFIAIILSGLMGYLMFKQVRDSSMMQERQANENIGIFQSQSNDTIKVFKEASNKTESVFSSQSEETKKVFENKTKVATEILKLMMTVEDLKIMAEDNLKRIKEDDKKAIAEMAKRIDKDKGILKSEIANGIKQKESQLKVALEKLQKDKSRALEVRRINNRRILFGIIIFSIIFIVVIFLYTIVLTHKVAGPLFKVSLYLKKMEDANFTPIWPLRKGDQLQDFYEKFSTAYKAVASRITTDVSELDRIITEFETSGADEKTLNDLKALRDRKKESVKEFK
ncbi:hypothetical protein KKF34_08335 [Myxococcota bacterium]|nr:hypothetical protein [Myxococcota bacterium]MBU1379239.1 hypothetical protein [Myxococcota bacterium]MBU1496870.1 hypothetical protein [Myxococcota bacterium]